MKNIKKKLIDPELSVFGPGGHSHRLECWLCHKEPAVYDGYPNWCFVPCWKCQKKANGMWVKKTFWQKVKQLFND